MNASGGRPRERRCRGARARSTQTALVAAANGGYKSLAPLLKHGRCDGSGLVVVRARASI